MTYIATFNLYLQIQLKAIESDHVLFGYIIATTNKRDQTTQKQSQTRKRLDYKVTKSDYKETELKTNQIRLNPKKIC